MEIPVIHEISRSNASANNSTQQKAQSSPSASKTNASSHSGLISPSTSSTSTNHFFQLARTPRSSQLPPGRGTSQSDMPKEEAGVRQCHPRTPIKMTVHTGEENSVDANQRSLHTRLPSTDSGIQLDSGFDSLSRYRGKNFLSSSSTSDSISTEKSVGKSSVSGTSSGYSSDRSQTPVSLSSKVLSLPAKSFVATSKPVTSVISASTSHGSPARKVVSSHNSSQPQEIHTSQNQARTQSRSVSSQPGQESSNQRSIQTSTVTAKTELYTTMTSPSNQSNSPLKPRPSPRKETSIASQKIGPSAFTSNQRTNVNATSARADVADPTYAKMSPNVKVITTQGGVQLSFSKNTVSISNSSQHPRTGSASVASSNSSTSHQPSVEISSSSDPNVKGGTTRIFSAPGSTLKLQVINAAAQGQGQSQGQSAGAKTQGQGCITLTRPLRLGAPSKDNVTAPPVTKTSTVNPSSSQPHSLANATRPQQQNSQLQQQNFSVGGRVKPKVPTKPVIVSKSNVSIQPDSRKPAPASSSSSSSSTANYSGATPARHISNGTMGSTSNSPQSLSQTMYKTEVPVVHRVKPSSQSVGRTEIPVKHVESSPSKSKIPPSQTSLHRPTSFHSGTSRYTPERDRHFHPNLQQQQQQHQSQHQPKQPIYENVSFNIKDGFSFDDQDTKMKHAELILKQSDELINDALKMLSTSSMSSRDVNQNGFPEGERIVEGSDAPPASEREHTVPIFDIRTGKLHGGAKTQTLGDLNSTSSKGKGEDVTWRERKNRIDSALSWLKTELAGLRDMDNTLISQFKRCQDTIETLKNQRDIWEGLSEEGEEGEYWDDYEINEFNKKYLDSPGGSSSSQFSPGSRDTSLHDVTSLSLPVPQLNLPGEKKTVASQNGNTSPKGAEYRRGSVTQDVEAIL